MTRGKDIFWAVLAAGLPLVGTLGFGYLERYFKDIWVRTYDARLYFFANIVLFLILGVLLAAMAVRFCSSPRETSRLPFIGLAIGWFSSVIITLFFILPLFGGGRGGLSGYIWTYGGFKDILYAGFYTVLLFWYRKHHTLVTAEDLKKEIEEA